MRSEGWHLLGSGANENPTVCRGARVVWRTLGSGASSESLFSSYNKEMLFFFSPLSSKAQRTLVENVGKVLKYLRRKKSKCEGGPARPRAPGTHVEAAVHGFSKPDMLLLLALAAPPVLLRHCRWVGVDASLACLHVAENFHSVQGAALVGVNPVVSCGKGGGTHQATQS